MRRCGGWDWFPDSDPGGRPGEPGHVTVPTVLILDLLKTDLRCERNQSSHDR
jgi:hypothetical protein